MEITSKMVNAALESTTPGEGPCTLEQALDFSGADTARRVVKAALEAALGAATPATKPEPWQSLPSDFQAVLHLSQSASTLTKLARLLDHLPKSLVRKLDADTEEALLGARAEAINLAGSIQPVIDKLNADATSAMEGGQFHA